MGLGPRTPITGPYAQRGRYQLLDAAVAVTDARPEWRNGFAFAADTCDAVDPMSIICTDDPAAKDFVGNPDVVTYDPFLLFGSDRCSAFDVGRDRQARARRNLLATESWQMERELFDGVASLGAGADPNPYLTDGNATDVTGGAALAAVAALARLEGELASCLHGQRGVIHATPEVVSLWISAGMIREAAALLLSVLGTIVVPGAGYSGNDPDGDAAAAGTSWAYGTGLVYSLRDTEFDPATDVESSRVDRGANTITYQVERIAAVFYAPCCVQAVHVDLTVPAAGT